MISPKNPDWTRARNGAPVRGSPQKAVSSATTPNSLLSDIDDRMPVILQACGQRTLARSGLQEHRLRLGNVEAIRVPADRSAIW